MSSVSVIFASGSGHTEYVVTLLAKELEEKGVTVALERAEQATPESFARGDALILASGTWNTGGVEGQLHPYMYDLLFKSAKDVDLSGKPCTSIALGDERYYYTGRAGEYLRKYIVDHNGSVFCDPLMIINEPYGQEEKVRKWAEAIVAKLLSC